jgi:exodeoxyribonuclease VII large subunit
MSNPADRNEPPDWALPSWDHVESDARPTSAVAPPGTFGLRIRSVSEVTGLVRDALRAEEGLRELWVEGEVGRVTVSSAGHAYFTLKDERSQLACVWFRDDRIGSPFVPQVGLRIVAQGRLDVFEAQGVYQLYVAAIQPAGFGDLAIRFEQLKAKLAAEGLFDAARKRPLPTRPGTIAVVTSPTGAVWHDIRTVLARRWPLADVVLSPCTVQGDDAPQTIVAALRRVERWGETCRAEGRADAVPALTIIARGGGSLIDMQGFNDERVVRAVAAHPIPVVAGVGHEVDVTLVDFAADVRAPTPSAAAELAVPDGTAIRAGLRRDTRRSAGVLAGRLAEGRRELEAEGRAIDRLRPDARLAATRERIGLLLDGATSRVIDRLRGDRRAEERLTQRLRPVLGGRLDRGRATLAVLAGRLDALGPGATLERGYAIVRRAEDQVIVRAPAEATAGTRLRLRVARGEFGAVAAEAEDTGSGR